MIGFGVKLQSSTPSGLMPFSYSFLSKLSTVILGLFLWISPVDALAKGGDLVKRSLRQVKEGDLEDAYKTLNSARIRNLDDFGINYVFSLYFLSPYQKTLKLDSSYSFCIRAIEKFETEDPAGKKRYLKLQIDSAELYSRRDYLDSLGFSQAERLESEAAYQYFLEKFPQSARAETARQKRASLAFQQARQQNSYEAFMEFLNKYPDAGEARSAKEISDLLVFENTSRKGKISDWENFIEKNPNNQYVVKAQNRLYELATLIHHPDVYYQFINRYPNNPNTRKAWEWIYLLDKQAKSSSTLAQKYPGFPFLSFEARLRLRDIALIPFLERGKFGFMQSRGQIFIRPEFDSLPADSRCELGNSSFVKVFRNHKTSLFTMDSLPISDGEFDDAEWFSEGIIKVYKGGKQGLLSVGGYQILGARYESISLLSSNLISIQQGNRFYLFTTKGQKLEIQGLDEVVSSGKYLACRLGEKIALLSESEALKSLEGDQPELQFIYSSFRKLANYRMVLFQPGAINLISGSKVLVVKVRSDAIISECPWGIMVERNGRFSVVDTAGNTLPRDYESLRIHGQLAIVRLDGKFGLIDRQGRLFVDPVFDTLSLLLRNSFLGKKGSRKYLIFESGKKISFSGNRSPEILRHTTPKGIFNSYYIVLTDSLDRKGVFSKQGKSILPFAYDLITMLDGHLFSISQDRKVGIADTNGSVLIKPSLSGVSPINREFVCVARGKIFSILNPYTRKTLGGNLSGIARNFGPSRTLFVIRFKDRAGVIDINGKAIVPSIYEDIMYWNPTRCLVKRNGFWYFYQLDTGKELVKAIKNIRVLAERDNETIYEVEADKKVGIESTLRGEIAPTDNDEIVPFESNAGLFFFAGRRVAQSSVYNLSYFDQNGDLIKTQLLTEDEYDQIVCD